MGFDEWIVDRNDFDVAMLNTERGC